VELSVQEQFYLFWPFLILLAPRRLLPHLLAATMLFAVAFRAVIFGFVPEAPRVGF